MPTSFLYLMVVLIWGSAWIAVKFQLGTVAPEVSVAYRMAIAAAIMFSFTLIRRFPLRFSARDHFFIALQGGLFFSTNFFLFYLAAAHLTTGLIALVCSTASVMTILLNALIKLRYPPLSFIIGALLGVAGTSIVFTKELSNFSFQSGAGLGLLLSLGGTFCFSLGSIISARNRLCGLSICGNTSWAMLYGAILLGVLAYFRGVPFNFDYSVPYITALIYLAVIASVVAFSAYLTLLSRIATEQAAYITVLFPIVALTLSTFFEGYQWSLSAVLGIFLILLGNIVVLRQPQ